MARSYDPDKIPQFKRGYWNRPPNQDQGNEKSAPVFQAVGVALTAWERLEEKIARMFLAIVEAQMSSADPTRRAFGAIESSATRRTMILAAAEAYFGRHWDDENIRVSFGRVLEAVSFASKRRDDIAHGIVEGNILDGKSFGHFLFPANYNTGRTVPFATNIESDPLYFTFTHFRYTSADILEFAHKFGELRNLVSAQTGLIQKSASGEILFVKAVTDDGT